MFRTFAAGDLYKSLAANWEKTLRQYTSDYAITMAGGEPLSSRKARQYKPTFIKERLGAGPIAWCDVDATFHKDPTGIYDLLGQNDLALHRLNVDGYTSCLVAFNPSDASYGILERWRALCEADEPTTRGTADEEYLSQAIFELKPKVVEIGPEWAWSPFLVHHGNVDPIISHKIMSAT